ncbi:adenylosuccinate synthase [Desulfoplanes formicivorans]|uniref:Adenylosuccinate synthetase n=1 Tax=Desulfoplanes formicivorans TaxID=1592317 RepID=A0A194AJA8_9BACT|nr:adenylosuccinate synthase [Desulfoplanes formicivorans]GAU08834.1 adenylosuccinate synthetase [Desulfoplanes formicivorans]
MSNTVVMGAQWGDEGKGKIVDLLTREADLIVRFQGGNNAGHTLVVGDTKCILHLIPSGILHADKICCIGNGVVLDPEVFCNELDGLVKHGRTIGPDHLMISKKTHVIMPYHKILDAAREAHKSGKDKIGTTGRGIGPCYEDKASRIGIRAGDLADMDLLRTKIQKALVEKNALFKNLYGLEPLMADEVLEQIRPFAQRTATYLGDVSAAIQETVSRGRSILFEGAQGTHLDIDHGTYPFVTSSNTVAGNAAAGGGCACKVLDRIVAVVKAYTTRVGSGPFPVELDDHAGTFLQEKGGEFGATTGRPRRCGWLDLVILRESVRLNGPTDIALTKLDVLGGLDEIKLCTSYRYDGREILYPPQEENSLARVEPVYESMPGWHEDISGCSDFQSLPQAARNYVLRVEELLGVPISLVSVGPDRDQTIRR